MGNQESASLLGALTAVFSHVLNETQRVGYNTGLSRPLLIPIVFPKTVYFDAPMGAYR
jgi:hypothetical protein